MLRHCSSSPTLKLQLLTRRHGPGQQNAPTACMRISSTVLEPAKCYSKAGIRYEEQGRVPLN